ncbi:DUF4082 domain-containing protein [Nocardioides zeae]|uniref:DUF4082 domain-containing protein n=1 Tax=Nocardioides imazamoxiresistens TaxID=3231893 RepID=A0ABU3PZG2_9ACTN|nr:DUF4082 domain-containing protein [Nocardioides zeae]MDT9594514.1 DUF4082 domain-containing protein [Nocardioides zeae]
MTTRPRPVPTVVLLVLALGAALLGVTTTTSGGAAAAVDPCATGSVIACENSKPGTPVEEWDVDRAGDESIQGFATDISVDLGDRIDFKVDTDARAYTVTIYRTGWYGGDGARRIASVQPSARLPQVQPECITDTVTELYDCGNWGVSASWTVPTTAVSGVYVARLERTDTGGASHITFVVRDDASTSDVVFQTSDTTWQAYNDYGGSDLYRGAANGRAYKVSYNRPVLTRGGIGGRDFYFANEYPMVRFLERNGYDVTYQAGVDTDRRGDLLTNHDVFLSVGHDEYWSGAQRAHVEAARDAGVHLMFLSGNEAYWRTRWEPSADPSRTAYRTLVSYKETWANDKIDPSAEWTGTWRDPRQAPPSAGAGRPENALVGTAYMVNYSDLALRVSATEGRLRLWRGTSLASLASGTTATLAPHTIGYESNEDLDNGHRPPGLVRLSTTVGAVPEYLQDYGNTVAPGTTRHHLTLYRAASGALVFSAGSVQWSWGLDAEHDSPFAPAPADVRMQQAQVNLFADMGVQPATLAPGLVRATASTDTTGPTVSVAAPTAGAAVRNGAVVRYSGTATDTGGGRVAGVEVSTDAGATWRPATGTTSWTFDLVQPGVGSVGLLVRAVDDSANIGPTATRSVQVSCPCSLFGATVPAVPAAADTGAVELGLRFAPTRDAFVAGVRFYKGSGNTGTHTGTLWSATGSRLATATFTSETATGWQTVRFTSPVPVVAGQTYVVSYSAPAGRYAIDDDAFNAAGRRADPLSVAGGYGAPPAGVFAAVGEFPDRSFGSSNYFVDPLVTMTDDSPLTLDQQSPLPGSSSVAADAVVSARFSRSVVATSVTVRVVDAVGAQVPGATAYDAATRTVTFRPSAPLAGAVRHTVTVTGRDAAGISLTATPWTFTTARPASPVGVCPCSLFDDGTTPTVLEDVDTAPVTLGVRFRPSVDGTVTAIRFYKGPRNTGTHTGTLWRADGTSLATGTFTGESTGGWQTLVLATPVAVTAGTEYVASYRAPGGRYSASPNAFAASDLSRGPLQVTSTAGAYTYGTGFPGSSSATSYLVDVVVERREPPLTVVSSDPAAGAVGVSPTTAVGVTFSAPLGSGHQVALTRVDTGAAVAGTTTRSADGTSLRFVPTQALPLDTEVRVTLTGLRSTSGATLADQTWTFRTREAGALAEQTLLGSAVPEVAAVDESAPVEVGVAFRVLRPGRITQLRFFKGPGNDGLHVASLWDASGRRLARVDVAGETASGWQTASLSTPVSVAPGQDYVVSYLAPRGHYSATRDFFAQPHTSGDLVTSSGANGRYLYGAAGGMPLYSWGATNYFVDVAFVPDARPVTLEESSPAAGASGVPLDALVRARLSVPVSAGSLSLRAGTTSVAGTASISADGREVVLDPAQPLAPGTTYTATLSGVRSTEGTTLATTTWTFETEAQQPTTTTHTLFGSTTPAIGAVDESDPVELGVVVTPSVSGDVTRIRFHKGSGNTGTHVGSVWTLDGRLLGRVTFTGESASGWQSAALATPVRLTAGTSYVVSYLAPRGHYSVTPGGLRAGAASGPLTAAAQDNGRYVYGAGGGFPTRSWDAANYFVDLEFRPAG